MGGGDSDSIIDVTVSTAVAAYRFAPESDAKLSPEAVETSGGYVLVLAGACAASGMGTALEDIVLHNSELSLVINEVMLLLSEKRTSLSMLRTGLGVVAIPLSIASFLVATSRLYETGNVIHLLAPLWAACIVLFVLGMHIVVRALTRTRRFDARIEELKARDEAVRSLIEVD